MVAICQDRPLPDLAQLLQPRFASNKALTPVPHNDRRGRH